MSLVAAGGATVFAATHAMDSNLERQAMTRVATQMKVARHLLSLYGDTAKITDGKLVVGDTILNGNMDLVTKLRDLVGGAATIFQGDVRVASTVVDTTGKLKDGTKLMFAPARQALFVEHHAYIGIATLFGEDYYSQYDPILDASGAQIGVLYVGFKKAEVSVEEAEGRTIIMVASASAILLILLIFVGIGRVLTGRIEDRETKLRMSRLDLEIALDNMPNGLCRWSADGVLMVANQCAATILDLPAGSLKPGLTYRQFFQLRLAAGHFEDTDIDELHAEWMDVDRRRTQHRIIRHFPDGKIVAVDRRPIQDGGWLSTYEDITEHEHAEAKMAFMARHDGLTQLPNRILFNERIDEALAGGGAAILCLDLDGFKDVNDSLGHPGGDLMLKAVATRLRGCVRSGDTVARVGGDEFAIVQSLLTTPQDAMATADRVLAAIGRPYTIEGQPAVIGVSVGIVVSDGTETPDTLLKQADFALYHAKAEGGGVFRMFEPEMHDHLQARRTLEIDIRKALADGQFEVFYQPLIDIRSGRASGFEALLRWRHPVRGLLGAGDIIPVAEETGLIVPIGAWALHQACADASKWPSALKVAVNLSAVQFRGGTLVATVRTALEDSGLAPDRLELEITETAVLREAEATSAILHELRALGVRIALDDFGTGYSSLSYVRNFPFDKIKIDRSFVDGIGMRRDSTAIIRAVTGLAGSLGIQSLAEGVETAEQYQWLAHEGCDEAQGYLFSVPRPNADVPVMIAQVHRPLDAMALAGAPAHVLGRAELPPG